MAGHDPMARGWLHLETSLLTYLVNDPGCQLRLPAWVSIQLSDPMVVRLLKRQLRAPKASVPVNKMKASLSFIT